VKFAAPPAMALLLVLTAGAAQAQWDAFGRMSEADHELSSFGALPDTTLSTQCRQEDIGPVLSLPSAIDRALCANPRVRQAWSVARFRAAQLGAAQSAKLPTLTLSGQLNRAIPTTTFDDFQDLSTTRHTTQRNVGLALNWVLYDAGLRSGNIAVARHTFSAATETQRVTILTAINDTGKAYYDWWATQGRLQAAREAERTAEKSLAMANARRQTGNGTLLDRLQAETALAQASLDRVTAETALGNARVALATLMAVPPTALPDSAGLGGMRPVLPDHAVEVFVEYAQTHSPSVRVAVFQLDTSMARVQVAEATNGPIAAITATMARNEQLAASLGQTFTTRVPSLNLQIAIPLFDGGAQAYQRHAAQSQVEAARDALENARLQVQLDVWKAHHELVSQAEKVKSARKLMESATQADSAAEKRYSAGAGTLLDLLNARTALADARQQSVRAAADWRAARLRLLTLTAQPLRWEADDES
jgi:outer membrane protein